MYKHYRPYQTFLVIADSVLTVLVMLLMVKLRPYLPGRVIGPDEVLAFHPLYLGILVLWLALFASIGVYALSSMPNFSKQVSRLTPAYLFTVLIFAGALYFSFREVSRMLVIYFAVTNYAALVVLRFFDGISHEAKTLPCQEQGGDRRRDRERGQSGRDAARGAQVHLRISRIC